MVSHIVNIGAIGVGAFMARQHLPNILKNPAIRLHTLCDLDAGLLQQRARNISPRPARRTPRRFLATRSLTL